MKITVKRWLTKATIAVAAIVSTLFITQTANAFTLIEKPLNSIEITSHSSISSNPLSERSINPYDSETIHLNYCINDDANVTVGIYKSTGRSSYNTVKTLTNDEFQTAGCYSLDWNGTKRNGKVVDDGEYYYGINVENADFTSDSDYAAEWVYVDYITRYDNMDDYDQYHYCGGYSDYSYNGYYCDAIDWVTEEGIFQGYYNGTFRPDQPVNRAEALKVILEFMDVNVNDRYFYVAFPDVPHYAWYTAYLQKAFKIGIVSGYPDGYFRPESQVNKVEALKMLLETGRYAHNLTVPYRPYGSPYWDTNGTNWYMSYVWMAKDHSLTADYYNFSPDAAITRGQLADMLYRYHLARLDR